MNWGRDNLLSIRGMVLCVSILLVVLEGCSTQIYDPHFWHTNFVDSLQGQVGLSIDNQLQKQSWTRSEVLVNVTKLPNGNQAYRYRLNQGCDYTYEVDSATHIIKAVRWNGSDQYCILVP
jgi:hypothetical protein